MTSSDEDPYLTDESLPSTMLLAVKKGDERTVHLLLDKQTNLEVTDSHGRTALHIAARYGQEAIIQLLLDNQADELSIDNTGSTVLHVAAQHGHEAIVQLLLNNRADIDINIKDHVGRTALSWAAGNGHAELVQLLLAQSGIEIDAKDSIGRTPLSWAAEKGSTASVQLLINDERTDMDAQDDSGQSPLIWAAGAGMKAVARLLLQRDEVYNNIIMATEFEWLQELPEGEYPRHEKADLLVESIHDRPWIYCTPQVHAEHRIRANFHVPGCVHQMRAETTQQQPQFEEQTHTELPPDDSDVRRQVEELCGIGGVIPSSTVTSTWDGTVIFGDQSSTSTISYAEP